MKLFFIYLLVILQLSHQKSTPESDTYRAAVVEFAAENSANDPPMEKNTNRYVQYIKQAGKLDVDIIVFPEDGLTSISIPEAREQLDSWTTLIPVNDNPCEKQRTGVSETINRISCAARDAKMYVVINIAEKLPCDGEGCPKDGMYFYNSQAVFDRNGKIIAKYRKTHLFYEHQFNHPDPAEIVTFDTDFNVTFGTFICFDIFFKEPALTLTRVHNVTDIVYGAAWFSELPFLTATATHGGFAYAEDINLLASGYNRPAFSNTGSGIYLGKKGIAKVSFGKSGDELLIYDVPKKNRKLLSESIKKNVENIKPKPNKSAHVHDELNRRKRDSNSISSFTIWKDDLHDYENHPLNWSVKQEKLCQGDFCCNFTIETSAIDSNSMYKLILFNGNKTIDDVIVGIQTCGIVRCANDSLTSCGLQLTSETTFSAVKISATFIHSEDLLVFPSSSNSSILPLNWTYKKTLSGNKVIVQTALNEPAKNVLTLGIYGRKFDRDITRLTKKTQTALTSTPIAEEGTAIGIQTAVFVILIVLSIAGYLWYRKRFNFKLKQSDEDLQSDYHHIQEHS